MSEQLFNILLATATDLYSMYLFYSDIEINPNRAAHYQQRVSTLTEVITLAGLNASIFQETAIEEAKRLHCALYPMQ